MLSGAVIMITRSHSARNGASRLIMPVLMHGEARAMLVLENNLSRGAFPADRLAAVNLIVGQLSVSLDNALIYSSLERKVSERTKELEIANGRLEVLAQSALAVRKAAISWSAVGSSVG